MNITIVGAGKLGIRIVEALIGGDYSITVIDKNPEVMRRISQQFDVLSICDDARKVSVLSDAGIDEAEYLLAATGNDETNIVISTFAKQLGCENVVARVRDPEHMNQFNIIKETTGIDHLVNPDFAITIEIFKYLAEKYSLSDGIFTSGRIAMTEFSTEMFPALEGLSMPEVSDVLPGVLIAALSRNGKVIVPHGNDEIRSGDFVYAIGETDKIQSIHRKTMGKAKSNELKKVMIVGGGKTGFYLADKLSSFGAAVKLIEKDLERCRYLSTNLDNVMVLHSDGTDLELLEEENMSDMDAFVTATGFDEENLLLALAAKQRGIDDVISKVSHDDYTDLIENLGIDMVLNPLDIITTEIIRHIQGSRRILSSVLIQGQAELMEVVATSRMKMVGVPLRDLDIPGNVLIAAIHRGSEVIIPGGETVIETNDRVTIFSLLSDIDELEKLMKTKKE